ncbi:uncharacterized protein B0H64DRAFT_446177 [Chaetomium fimeti]|uniref:DUF7136 domain-containing protein n=1 Tax=Chaetomium fimeti TaxID=1854472 RepID=A0AAE0LNL6_9PEZI|nr:hypothetical protein B0H64DRAFT_446177 [Chaetomium fimeti]
MHLVSRAVRFLVVSLTYLGAVVDAAGSGVLEADLIFPRNETYAPTDSFPIFFAFQNAELAWYLNTDISYTLGNRSDLLGDNPFAVEGQWWLSWEVGWQGCLEDSFTRGYKDPDDPGIISNRSRWSVDFTISSGGQAADLATATADYKTCPGELGVAIKVTGETKRADELRWSGGDTSAVLDISSPTPTPNPCAVKIDSATAASISASWTTRLCNNLLLPDCPPRPNSASQRLAVAGVVSLAAAFGAFGFLFL